MEIKEQEQPLLKNVEGTTEADVDTHFNSSGRFKNVTTADTVQEVHETTSENPIPQQAILKQPKTKKRKIVRKTFKGTAVLSKLLPTGSALTFQLLSPIVTNQGRCKTLLCQQLTFGLVSICVTACFFLSFTDSFRDERGKVRYGLATFRGLWVMDGPLRLSVEEANKYKIKFIDFFHALVSVMIFMALVLFDHNVVDMFCPKSDTYAEELWRVLLPASIGAIGCLLFVTFPSKRHGIGCPLSKK